MTKITIPPQALEAGARAIAESLRTARLTLETEDGYKPEARACFQAMVEAWPGMERHTFPETGSGDDYIPPIDEIFLPLPTENPDAET